MSRTYQSEVCGPDREDLLGSMSAVATGLEIAHYHHGRARIVKKGIQRIIDLKNEVDAAHADLSRLRAALAQARRDIDEYGKRAIRHSIDMEDYNGCVEMRRLCLSEIDAALGREAGAT